MAYNGDNIVVDDDESVIKYLDSAGCYHHKTQDTDVPFSVIMLKFVLFFPFHTQTHKTPTKPR